jgi:hypothetical protein
VLSYLWVVARNDQSNREQDSLPKVEPSTTVKRDQILKLLRQVQKQKKIRLVRNLSVRAVVGGQEKEVRQRVGGGSVKMEQKNIILTLATMLVVGVFASYGMVVKQWVDWTTTTLVDLDKRTAIMEIEMKHTNEMVAQNHQMLKTLMEAVTEVSYGNGKVTDGTTDINWQKTEKQ